MQSQVLGLDLLGGDHPPEAFIPGLVTLLDEVALAGIPCAGAPFQRLGVFATASFLEHWREGSYAAYLQHPALWVIPVAESVQMEDLPLQAIRHKKHSSVMQGMSLLRDKTLDALISIGNTGALVAAATLHLPLSPGVRRLGLLACVPTRRAMTAVIDVGATLEPTSADLMQWTALGVHHLRSREGVHVPRVGLLNIGEEAYKGNALQREVHALLSEYPGITFVGNVESEEVYQGAVDLLVTDGYSGNIFLKTSKAVRDFICSQLQLRRPSGLSEDFASATECLFRHASSAYLLGTPFCIMKCHGSLQPELFPDVVRRFNLPHL